VLKAVLSIAAIAGSIAAAPGKAQTERGAFHASSAHAERVVVEGKTFMRLRARQLETVVVGRQIMNPVQHAPHPVVMFFEKGGTYEAYVGRDPLESGTYAISNDAVLVRVPGEKPLKRRFYRAADGELMMATSNGPGEARWTKVISKPL
jgi:hypothetical protein